jgi:hypothetical protein
VNSQKHIELLCSAPRLPSVSQLQGASETFAPTPESFEYLSEKIQLSSIQFMG